MPGVDPLLDLLAACVVPVERGGRFEGSGFWVAPGEVLTCAHVVHGGRPITVRVGPKSVVAEPVSPLLPPDDPAAEFYPQPDAVLLRVPDAPPGHPCVRLEAVTPAVGENLQLAACSVGEHAPGKVRRSGTSLHMEGPFTDDEDGVELFKLSKGQVIRGYSGGPLLNRRTGGVCALVDSSRGIKSDLGGFGVPVALIDAHINGLVDRNAAFHAADAQWADEVAAQHDTEAERARMGRPMRGAPTRRGAAAHAGRQPPGSYERFVGRGPELDELLGAVSHLPGPRDVRPIISIDGLPGVGKTRLARELIDRLPEELRDLTIIQPLDAHVLRGSPRSTADVLKELLRNIQSAVRGDEDVDRLQEMWRTGTAGRRMTLLLDDAMDDEQVIPLLPAPSRYSVVIVTSRAELPRVRERRSVSKTLELLSEGEAAALFVDFVGSPSPEEEPALKALTRWCHRLPLTITVLAGEMRGRSGYRDQLAEITRMGLLATSRDDQVGIRTTAALDLSYGHLPEPDRRTLRLISRAPVPPTVDAFAVCALADVDPRRARASLELLYKRRLVQHDGASWYRMYDLIREYAHDVADEEPGPTGGTDAVERMFAYYRHTAATGDGHFARQPFPASQTFPAPEHPREFQSPSESIAWLRKALPSLISIVEYTAQHDMAQWTISLTDSITALLRNDGLWDRSEGLHLLSLAAAEQLGNRTARANSLLELGVLHRLRGQMPLAAGRFQEALALYQASNERRGQAHALNNMGVVKDVRGDFIGSLADLRAALILYKDLGDPLGEANVLHDTGFGYRRAHDFTVAAVYFERALALYEAADNLVGKAHARLSAGRVRLELRQFDRAEQDIDAARSAYAELGNQLGVGNVTFELARIRRARGDLAGAIELQRELIASQHGLGNLRGEAEARLELSELLRQTGDTQSAQGESQTAMTLLAELDITLTAHEDPPSAAGDLPPA